MMIIHYLTNLSSERQGVISDSAQGAVMPNDVDNAFDNLAELDSEVS